MMKKFSIRANKWTYVFALISHIFNFFAEPKSLFLYHIDDYQEDYLFFADFIEFFYSIFKSIFKSSSFSSCSFLLSFFFFFSCFVFFSLFLFVFVVRLSFVFRRFFVICSIFERSKSSSFPFFSFCFFSSSSNVSRH